MQEQGGETRKVELGNVVVSCRQGLSNFQRLGAVLLALLACWQS